MEIVNMTNEHKIILLILKIFTKNSYYNRDNYGKIYKE